MVEPTEEFEDDIDTGEHLEAEPEPEQQPPPKPNNSNSLLQDIFEWRWALLTSSYLVILLLMFPYDQYIPALTMISWWGAAFGTGYFGAIMIYLNTKLIDLAEISILIGICATITAGLGLLVIINYDNAWSFVILIIVAIMDLAIGLWLKLLYKEYYMR